MMDEAWKKFFVPRVLESLRGTTLRAKWAADGTHVGSHRSTRSGQAIEFAEHRQYTAGDDLRQLDWKVLGRTDKYYLRQREDETTLQCHLIVDRSGSMAFQGERSAESKLTVALRIAASLAFVASENHDTSSLTCVGQSLRQVIGAGSGASHLMAMAGIMNKIDSEHDGAIAAQCTSAMKGLRAGGLVVLISDLFDEPEDLIKAFRAVRSTGRAMLVIQVLDPSESIFPFGDTIEYVGLEGEAPLTIDSRGIAMAYQEEFRDHQNRLEIGCRENAVTLWRISSDDSLEVKLPAMLSRL